MPFTFSHPALILPLGNKKFGLSLTGLIAGSMVPDFEFFMSMRVSENIGHHWQGIFLFDIPLAFLLCFLFHNLIRNMLIGQLPIWYRCRFVSLTKFNWNAFAASNKIRLSISILIGIASHLLWDGFTHYDGFFVEIIPFLNSSIRLLKWSVKWFMLLQIVCSIWGLCMVQLFIAKMPDQEDVVKKTSINFLYWAGIFGSGISILAIRIIALPQYQTNYDMLFAAIGSFLYALVITTLTCKKWNLINSK